MEIVRHVGTTKTAYGGERRGSIIVVVVVVSITDTDSCILTIETEDFYKEMRENIDRFDTSDYPWPKAYGIERKNKKILGLFKDELDGKIMSEFVGLRAKCYAVRSLDGKSYNEKMKKAKGVKKNVLKCKITFNDYIKCIEDHCEMTSKRQVNDRIRIVPNSLICTTRRIKFEFGVYKLFR